MEILQYPLDLLHRRRRYEHPVGSPSRLGLAPSFPVTHNGVVTDRAAANVAADKHPAEAAAEADGTGRLAAKRVSYAAEPSTTPSPPTPSSYRCALSSEPLPEALATALLKLQTELGMPLWLVSHMDSNIDAIDGDLWGHFYQARRRLPASGSIAVLVDSPGGDAGIAYKLARLFERGDKGWIAVVPRYAKSAATLLCLGARSIAMGPHAELGPLDAQVFDPDREDFGSTLNEVHALQRLHARALEAVDETMILLAMRTGKKVETLLPHTLQFIASTMRPLFEKVDTVHYTSMARILKVGEEYATRLLMAHHSLGEASTIARHLVENYPDHGFVITRREANEIGITIGPTSEAIDALLDDISDYLDGHLLLGPLEEVKP
jgi:hypothetical protein